MPQLRCKSGFLLPNRRVVRSGEIVDATDPVVQGRENLFEPFETVEQATRAPGEVRVISNREDRDKPLMQAEHKTIKRGPGRPRKYDK